MKYGKAQAITYAEEIKQAIEVIIAFPLLGHHRPDIPSGYRARKTGEHVVIYRVQDKTINVVRILHRRMNFKE